jgi:hypothetical protein
MPTLPCMLRRAHQHYRGRQFANGSQVLPILLHERANLSKGGSRQLQVQPRRTSHFQEVHAVSQDGGVVEDVLEYILNPTRDLYSTECVSKYALCLLTALAARGS